MQKTFLDLNLEEGRSAVVIGDVHECASELEELVLKVLSRFAGTKPVWIFAGDLIDKGQNTAATLKLVEDMVSCREVYFCAGNHERWIAGRLDGKIAAIPELEQTVFDSYQVLRDSDSEARARFDRLYPLMYPSIRINREGLQPIWVSHAPCSEVDLGGDTPGAIRNQCNLYFPERTHEGMARSLAHVYEEAHAQKPWHVFGHVAIEPPVKIMGNKIWLDTGCVAGGALSAAVFHGKRLHIESVRSTREKQQDLFDPALLTRRF